MYVVSKKVNKAYWERVLYLGSGRKALVLVRVLNVLPQEAFKSWPNLNFN